MQGDLSTVGEAEFDYTTYQDPFFPGVVVEVPQGVEIIPLKAYRPVGGLTTMVVMANELFEDGDDIYNSELNYIVPLWVQNGLSCDYSSLDAVEEKCTTGRGSNNHYFFVPEVFLHEDNLTQSTIWRSRDKALLVRCKVPFGQENRYDNNQINRQLEDLFRRELVQMLDDEEITIRPDIQLMKELENFPEFFREAQLRAVIEYIKSGFRH